MSEGINFADAHARAVVVLGIPYPNVKDSKVTLKKKFNSHPRNKQRGLVSGDEWYSLQAYRAMNQVRVSVFAHPVAARTASHWRRTVHCPARHCQPAQRLVRFRTHLVAPSAAAGCRR